MFGEILLGLSVMNEWHPLRKASAKCGYSLVSHPEGIVIHAPYMPCTEAKVCQVHVFYVITLLFMRLGSLILNAFHNSESVIWRHVWRFDTVIYCQHIKKLMFLHLFHNYYLKHFTGNEWLGLNDVKAAKKSSE